MRMSKFMRISADAELRYTSNILYTYINKYIRALGLLTEDIPVPTASALHVACNGTNSYVRTVSRYVCVVPCMLGAIQYETLPSLMSAICRMPR